MKSCNIKARSGFLDKHIIQVVAANKNKVTAITKMACPTNKKQVQSFIGMINYLSKFSARLSEIAEPIQELAKDKVPFNLGPEHQSAFKKDEGRNFKCSYLSLLQY